VAAGSLRCPHPTQRRDTKWYSVTFSGGGGHIHHLATDPRGLDGVIQRLLTPGTVIRGDLERLIRIIDHTPRRRHRTRLLIIPGYDLSTGSDTPRPSTS
jgi:hypothetical protein